MSPRVDATNVAHQYTVPTTVYRRNSKIISHNQLKSFVTLSPATHPTQRHIISPLLIASTCSTMHAFNLDTHATAFVAVSATYLLFALHTLAYTVDTLTSATGKITTAATTHTPVTTLKQRRQSAQQNHSTVVLDMSIDIAVDPQVNATVVTTTLTPTWTLAELALNSRRIVNFGPDSGYVYEDRQGHVVKRENIEYDLTGLRVYNVGVLMASHLGKLHENFSIKKN